MKKILCFVIVLILLLSACSTVYDGDDAETVFLHQEVDLSPKIEKNVSLYFLSDNSSRLAAETRTLLLEQTETDEEQIISELLSGPADDNLKAFDGDFKLDRIELLSNVANVYLTTGDSYSDKTMFSLALAITNTLTDFSPVTYVSVFVNGKAIAYNDMPVGALTKNQNDIADEIAKQEQRAENKTFNTVLYFLDPSGEFIVPEVRQITYSDNDYAAAIISELAKGPQERYYYKDSVVSALSVLTPTKTKEVYSGTYDIIIDLNRNPLNKSELSLAAICYSVCGFVPDINSLRYTVLGNVIDQKTYKKSDFAEFVGSEITLYFASEDGLTLSKTSKTVPYSEIGLPAHVVSELIAGAEHSVNKNVLDVFPSGIDDGDVIYVYIANDIAVVNWSSSILPKIQGMSLNKERLLVYSVVNSLTYLKGITKVQFLVDGERTDKFGDNIDIRDPLLKNVGLIK